MMADHDASRKLVAILSADVVGYSRLMGEDEQATIATLSACRDIFTDTITAHQGRVVDTAGDCVLAVFPSVVELEGEGGSTPQRRLAATGYTD
jgi:class 3 adenylate cyclase